MEEYTNENFSEEIEERFPIKMWMLFEVQGVNEDVVSNAMKKHIKNLSDEEGVFIKKYLIEDVEEMDASKELKQKGVERLYSQIGECVVHIRDFSTALRIVMNYAPSAIEVIKPEKYEITLRDMQDALSSVSDLLHKILSHGMGGVVLKM